MQQNFRIFRSNIYVTIQKIFRTKVSFYVRAIKNVIFKCGLLSLKKYLYIRT